MLKSLIESRIKTKNFKGIAVCVGNKSIVHWWDPADKKINELSIDFKIDKPISFQCIDGNFEFMDF